MQNDTNKRAGAAVLRARREAHMTQAALAEAAGIAQADISRLENGRGNPTMRTLARVAEVLHCRLDVMLAPDPDGADVGAW